jgi:hypothetical protein
LTREEQEREEVRQAQADVAIGVDTRHAAVGAGGGAGILFPFAGGVEQALVDLRAHRWVETWFCGRGVVVSVAVSVERRF